VKGNLPWVQIPPPPPRVLYETLGSKVTEPPFATAKAARVKSGSRLGVLSGQGVLVSNHGDFASAESRRRRYSCGPQTNGKDNERLWINVQTSWHPERCEWVV
jgi:hypothetical protein